MTFNSWYAIKPNQTKPNQSDIFHFYVSSRNQLLSSGTFAQSSGAVEYTDCTSAEG